MDFASIGAAIASGKALKDIIQGLVGLKVDTEVLYRINEAQTQVSNLLGALLEAQGDLFKLLNENQELRRQIQTHEDWEKRKGGYQLQQTAGGALVYASLSTSPAHYLCPHCFEKRDIQILQDLHVPTGAFGCPGCKEKYPVKRPTPITF
jgi:hypothetical protein